jgi:NADPH:quinone reductase-like Zn-dependent oxidoreductase
MANQIVISRAGGPDVLVDRVLEPQRLAAGEVRVQVEAAGVNFADVVGRLGNYPDAPPIPYCPGYEVAGTVSELGADVKDVAVGDRVCALTRFGGYSEEIITRAEGVFRIPDGVELAAAAGVPVTYLTAQTCLFDAGGLAPGKKVLILGGAGGVGSAAIQLARRVPDVTILATAGGEAKCEWMRKEGVHHPIDHSAGDVAEKVAEATGGVGVDLVLDPIGGRNVQKSVAMCRSLGRVALYGVSAMSPGKKRQLLTVAREGLPMRFFNLLPLFDKNVGVHPINMLHLAEAEPALMQTKMAEILRGIAEGTLAPVIAQRLRLNATGAREAHHYLQDRKNIGKVVLVREAA